MHDSPLLITEFIKQCNQHTATRWVVGLSGGLDSIVLLELAFRTLPVSKLHVVHVNHHLQDKAGEWAAFCEKQASIRGLPFSLFDVSPQSASEASAREARYAAFESFIQEGDILLLAHHANDQAETLLFRLMRGAGLRGLSGIPKTRALHNGVLLRPLLACQKSMLEAWAQAERLRWIDDPSNTNTDYDRNFLRISILPLLKNRWSFAVSHLAQASQYLAQDYSVLSEYLEEDLAGLLVTRTKLDCSHLSGFSIQRQVAIVRYWFNKMTDISLTEKHAIELNQLLNAQLESLQLGRWALKRYRQYLYIVDMSLPITQYDEPLLEGVYRYPTGVLVVKRVNKGMCIASLEGVRLSSRQEGMHCRPAGRQNKSLKKLFQEADIPAWQRIYWPVLTVENEVVAIPNICVAEGWQCVDDLNPGYEVIWEPF